MGVGGLRRRWREGRLLGMRSVHQPRGFKYEARKGTKEETTLPPSLSTPSSDGLIKNIRGENNIGFLAPLHKNLTVSLTSLSHSPFLLLHSGGWITTAKRKYLRFVSFQRKITFLFSNEGMFTKFLFRGWFRTSCGLIFTSGVRKSVITITERKTAGNVINPGKSDAECLFSEKEEPFISCMQNNFNEDFLN